MTSTHEFPVIETDRLILRGPDPSDWETDRGFRMSERSRHVGGPYTEAEAFLKFSARWGHWAIRGFGGFVVIDRETENRLGVVGPLYPVGWAEPELGWVVYEGAEGHGYAYEAALAARSYVYSELGWTTAISYVGPENHRSIALAKRLGCFEVTDVAHPFDEPCLVFRHPGPEALT